MEQLVFKLSFSINEQYLNEYDVNLSNILYNIADYVNDEILWLNIFNEYFAIYEKK